MDNLKVRLENCYGISSLDETFDLSNVLGKAKAYAGKGVKALFCYLRFLALLRFIE